MAFRAGIHPAKPLAIVRHNGLIKRYFLKFSVA